MKKTLLIVLAGLLSAAASSARLADSPQAVRPLLVGAEVPDVSLKAPDGSAVELRGLVRERAAIIVFYRGAW